MFCAIALFLIQSAVSDFNQKQEEISSLQQEIIDKEKQLDDSRNESASNLLRQKNRNRDLSDEIKSLSEKSGQVEQSLNTIKNDIEDLESAISRQSLEKKALAEKQSDALKDFEETRQRIKNLQGEVPLIQQQTDDKRLETRDLKIKISELSDRLESFSEITTVVRGHYLSVVSAIRQYERTRDWLESGEKLSLELSAVDLSSGYVALSKGAEAGIRDDMIFSVQFNNVEISQLRIKKSFRSYSLAQVIPLLGNAEQLQILKKVDLIVM